MKLAILQWCDSKNDRGMGTIERISTTGADCVDFFKRQMDAFGYNTFVASENGQMSIEHPEFNKHERFITSYNELKKLIQLRLDEDVLGQIYKNYHWWRIQFRNLH